MPPGVLSANSASLGVAFASGSAALAAISQFCPPGGHIICVDDVYGGTRRYLTRIATVNGGIRVDFVQMDSGDLADTLHDRITDDTAMIWVETPSNPTLKLVNIEAVAAIVKARRRDGQRPILVVDNTFMSPVFQQPILLGADLVVHSISKYLNGHSDVIMGAVVGRDRSLGEHLRFLQNALGAVPSPFDCYLVLRGMRTLFLRMRQHEKNAMAVAQFLSKHPAVSSVYYPGLPSHPQHELARRQQTGFGGMVSFALRGTDEKQLLAASSKFCAACRIFTLAESLGCVESLCEVPAVMTHAAVAEEARLALGITNGLIRLSVGIEDASDLIADLGQALAGATTQ